MAEIRCGNCGGTHGSAAEVKQCFAAPTAVGATAGPAGPADAWYDDASAYDDYLGGEEPVPYSNESVAFATAPQASGRAGETARSHPKPAPTVTRPLAELAGPDALGRNLAVRPGDTAPPPWDDAPRVNLAEDRDEAFAALLPRWLSRQRTVIEVDGDADADEAPRPTRPGEPWTTPATFTFDAERTWHVMWANTIDARRPDAPRWRWTDEAVAAGASPGGPADVTLGDGTAVWCDGGPIAPIALDHPVVHRISLERRLLTPLGGNETNADLAPDQLAAVTHPGGAARIIAPAGSGKTRVLTERARHLLRVWEVPPGAVTLVAFNKRAADEMVERTPDLHGLQVRTLNALGFALIDGRRPFAPRGGRTNVVNERDVRRILDRLIETPRRRLNTDPMAPWLEALSAVRLGLRDPAEVEAAFGGDVDGLTEVFPRFRAALAEANLVDFDEQIYRAIEVLLTEPETRRAAQRTARLLLVDEFQDLTPAHLLLVRLLSGPEGSVFGVGDDDQTIYGYTGATPNWLITYEKLFPGAGDHPLHVNYRCPPAVVHAAGRVLGRNRHRVPKDIQPAPSRTAVTGDLRILTDGDPLAATVETVRAALADGASPSDIAVLTRVNASLAPVQVALMHEGVLARAAVGEYWLERTGVRAALGWLRLSGGGPLRAKDLAEAARRPGRGLSARVIEWMGEQRDIDGLLRLAGRLKDRDGEKIETFVKDLEAVRAVAVRGGAAVVLTHVRDRIGLDDAMDALDSYQRSVKGSAQGDDLDALVALASLHPDADSFGSWLREQLSLPGDPGGVLLATVHAVKGLEWPHVIVHEASAGLFPHRLATDTEEERRVFHVGITRGSQCVTVTTGQAPSPFVAELTTDAPKLQPDRAPVVRQSLVDKRLADAKPKPRASKQAPSTGPAADADPVLREALRTFRSERARADGVPAYVVFNDKTLDELASRKPKDLRAMGQISGIGPAKLERYGDDILAIIVD